MTDANYINNLMHLANTPAKTESPLFYLEKATGNTGIHTNANKIESLHFKQGALSYLRGKLLEFLDQSK